MRPTAPRPVAPVRCIPHPDPERSRRWMREQLAPLSRWFVEDRDGYVSVHCPQEERKPWVAGVVSEPSPRSREEGTAARSVGCSFPRERPLA